MQALLQKIGLQELRLALLGVGVAITVAVISATIVPKSRTLIATNELLAVHEQAAEDGDELDRMLQHQNAVIESLRHRLYGDMASLPARQVEAHIIGQLQRLSWNNGVELVSVRPSIGERVQVFQEMLFAVELSGHYGDLYRWLWDVRNDLGFVVVKKLDLARAQPNDDEPLLTARLDLASYRAIE